MVAEGSGVTVGVGVADPTGVEVGVLFVEVPELPVGELPQDHESSMPENRRMANQAFIILGPRKERWKEIGV
jgi:hypothetical protein